MATTAARPVPGAEREDRENALKRRCRGGGKRGGRGSFGRGGAREQIRKRELAAFKQHHIPGLVNRARLLGLSDRDTVKLVRDNCKEQTNG